MLADNRECTTIFYARPRRPAFSDHEIETRQDGAHHLTRKSLCWESAQKASELCDQRRSAAWPVEQRERTRPRGPYRVRELYAFPGDSSGPLEKSDS